MAVLTVAMALGAAGLAVELGPVPRLLSFPHLWWPILCVAFVVSELALVRTTIRRQNVAFTVAELPLVVGLLLTRPDGLVLAWVVGSAVTEGLIRRHQLGKACFNLAKVALQAGVAVVVYRSVLALHPALGPWGWLAAVLAVLATSVASSACVLAVVSLVQGHLPHPWPVADIAMSALAGLLGACLALIGVIVAQAQLGALSLLVGAGFLVFLVLRSYAALRKRHHNLQALYEFTREVNGAAEPGARVLAILSGVRDMLQADHSTLVLPDPDGGVAITRLWSDDRVTTSQRGDLGPVVQEALTSKRSLAMARSAAEDCRARILQDPDLADALVAPLTGRAGILGLLSVAHRRGARASFGAEERELFDALAGHAGVNIDNDRLVDRLRQEVGERAHEASHDALTGLANRSLLAHRMGEVLDGDSPSATLLLVDLDRFKEVNDTLGHHNGDLLLCQAASRLRGLVAPDALVARLGGDEFAVLVPGQADRARALSLAQLVGRALQAPYQLPEVSVEVAGSVGVVTAPRDGTDPAVLLQRADVAMYQAKSGRSVALAYDPSQDHHSRRRLLLAGELRRAITRDALDVAFQPVVRLSDGHVMGAEALVRWSHPRLGEVTADEIVATAERTGVIWPLTSRVLGRALEQCARWREPGRDLSVQVNLSARSLLDTDLGAKVREVLARTGVPASALTLEVTESSLVTDLPRSVEVLERIRQAGVKVAIDDFGVGHSSLTYLRRLPCDVIKVDRSFVQGMATSRADQIIVSSTIALAHSLGLDVVAEGVVDPATWTRLRALGCDGAQGHLIAPALAPEELEAWLARWAGGGQVATWPLGAATTARARRLALP